MSLAIKEQSDQVKAAAAAQLPVEVSGVFTRDRQALDARGVPLEAVAVGDVLEDFALPDATGRHVSLSELVADGPAALVFYRAGWCPFCNLALHQYQSELMPQLGARALGLDISEGNAEGSTELPMPTVLIVDRDRAVRFVDVHPDYTGRTEVAAILSVLQRMRGAAMSKPGNVIRFTTTPDGADEFAAVLERAIEHVRAETGTTTWMASRSEDDPTTYFIVDLFDDAAARSGHFEGSAAALILGEGGPLLAGQPDIAAVQLVTGKNV